MKKPISVFMFSMVIMVFSCPSLMGQAGGDLKTEIKKNLIFELLSESGKIIPDIETNSFLVIDYPANLAMVGDYLKMADVPGKQVLIEAKVVEVKLAKEHALGVNWALLTKSLRIGDDLSFYGVDSLGVTRDGLWQTIPLRNPKWEPLKSGGETQNPFAIGLFNDNIDIVLQCLTTQLDTEILSAPKITTTNNRRARIDVAKTVPYIEKVEKEEDEDTHVVTYTYTYTFADEGVNLSVTPLINPDGSITMSIYPQVKEIVAWHDMPTFVGAEPPRLPETDVRVTSTKVTVRQGQTIIIGGLIRNKIKHGVTKVPLLGDLPFLKNIFRSKIDTIDKTELIIFVSPTIITPDIVMSMGKQRSLGMTRLRRQRQEKEDSKILYQRLGRLAKETKDLSKKRRNLQKEIIKEKNKNLPF